ncbi:hypothetical protein [Methylobacterium durans]|uniref:Flagellar protein FlaG n=1 Tax=Methylobacterium durans TaxID=2202825 RepID=A0A2U8W7G9_9HYPH|nr:hypothetical protein [Methylobacterium durans]AWN42045.1 hypothetical protein DK389_18010 [Methylobacterium durans]
MDIRAVATSPPVAAATPVTATPPRPDARAEPQTPLAPAVSLSIGEAAEARAGSEAAQQGAGRGAYTRDAESQTLVYQVVDPASGDIVIQIPDEVVLRARVYAREASEATVQKPGAAVERRA